ncbi:hypothetical protein ACIP4S_32595 [Streptomyces chartreusis]|uniref:hypothetical protein n=1 Tax=Streptomyces chartreusis TaxID=1969 RepID=UPI003812C09E
MKGEIRNSGDAHAEGGGYANTGVHVGDVYMGAPTSPAHSEYLHQVEQVFPWELVGREAELAELTRFCTAADGPAYAWWQGPPWAGKSALMAWFVQHPPPGVRLISFFITARWPGQSDRTAFLQVVVEQLAAAAGQPMPHPMVEATQAGSFNRLLKEAAAACAQAGERLVLVVDGLDEDGGVTVGPDGHSIAALLPANPPPGVRVLVSGRPHPPVPRDVPARHPLRVPETVRPLSASPEAQIIRDDAERELDRLLDDHGPGRDLVGFVATAGGGLTSRDLAELTGLPERTLVRNLRAVTGRTFQRRNSGWSTDDVFVLAHEELQQAAVENLAEAERAHYLALLHAWADRHRTAGWPEGSPPYLLRGYYQLLYSQSDFPRMLVFATDNARLDRMLDVAGGDATAFADITLAQGMLCAQEDPDLVAMLDLAASRYRLFQRSSRIPPSLPLAWAAVGNVARAETLARSIVPIRALGAPSGASGRIPGSEKKALRLLSAMLAEGGDLDRAEQIARAEGTTWSRGLRSWDPLAPLLKGLVAAGQYDRAQALSTEVPGWYLDLSVVLADAFVSVGELDRATHAVRAIDDPAVLARPAVRLARAYAEAGRSGDARSLARWAEAVFVPEPGGAEERAEQIRSLTVVAKAMLAAEDHEGARRLATRIEELGRGGDWIHALARLLPLWRDLGEPQEVARIRALAEAAVYGEHLLPAYAAPELIEMVRALIDLGDHDEARRLLQPALKGALENLERRYPYRGPGPLLTLMPLLATMGELEQLDGIADRIDDPEYRDEALIVRVELHVAEGAFERACATARRLAGPDRRANVLSRLVHPLMDAQHFDLVESVLADLSDQRHWNQAYYSLAAALATAGAWDRAAALVELVPHDQRVEPLLHLAHLASDEDRQIWARRALAALAETTAWDRVARLGLKAEALAAAGDAEAARRAADQAEELLRSSSDMPPRMRVSRWNDLLFVVCQALGDKARGLACAQEAGNLADSLTDPAEHASALEELAETLLGQDLVDESAAVAQRIPDDQMRSALLTRIFSEALAVGEADRAERYAQPAFDAACAIGDPWVQDRALAELAEAARDGGWLGDAAVIAGAIEAPWPRAAALAEIVHSQAEAGDADAARALAADAESAAASIVAPFALARAEAWAAAVWAATGSSEEALAHAWSADRAACRVIDLWDRCAIFCELARTHHALDDSDTAQTYAEAVDHLTREFAAPAVLAGLQSTAAEAWLAVGLPDRGEEAVRALAAAAAEVPEDPDGDPTETDTDERSLAELVELFLEAGEVERAGRIAATFPAPTGDSPARELLARAWLDAGELGRAEEVVQPHTEAAVALVRAYTVAGRGDAARALAERIESAARVLPSEYSWPKENPWAEAMVWAVRGWAAADETERAAELARTVEKAALSNAARLDPGHMRFFEALVQAGALDRAERIAATLPFERDRFRALTTLAKASAEGGYPTRARGHAEAAEALVQASDGAGRDASTSARESIDDDMLAEVVSAFSTLGDLDHARTLADGITDWRSLADAQASIALRLIADGDLAAAETIITDLPDWCRDRHLPTLMDAWVAAGDSGRACALAEAASGDGLRAPLAQWLVRELMAEGDEVRARALAERMEEAARAADWEGRTRGSVKILVLSATPPAEPTAAPAITMYEAFTAWLTVGDLTRADATAEAIHGTADQISTHCVLATEHMDAGDEVTARRLLTAIDARVGELKGSEYRDSVSHLTHAWARLGDFERAIALAEAADLKEEGAGVLASLARFATPPLCRRLLCKALAQHIDHSEIIHTVAALAPEAIRAARHP